MKTHKTFYPATIGFCNRSRFAVAGLRLKKQHVERSHGLFSRRLDLKKESKELKPTSKCFKDYMAHGANSVRLKTRVPYLCVFENCLHTFRPMSREFIEAHHTKPVTELHQDGEKTQKEDIELVCANCHRMLHRKRPWLKMNELKKLTKTCTRTK